MVKKIQPNDAFISIQQWTYKHSKEKKISDGSKIPICKEMGKKKKKKKKSKRNLETQILFGSLETKPGTKSSIKAKQNRENPEK